MLKGSLQTVALSEVLNFLADTTKSGELHVAGSQGEGRLWFDQGRISGVQVTRAQEPSEAIFQLLRVEEGEFDFASDAEQPEDVRVVEGDAGEVAPALLVAQSKLAEWPDIVAVVPSLAHGLNLRSEPPAEPVTLDPEQWMMVVAIGAGHSVAEVIDARDMQEFDGCKAVRALVDASLVDVAEPVVEEAHPVDAFVALDVSLEPAADVAAGIDDEPFGFHVAEPSENGFSSFALPGSGADEQAASEEGDHYAALRAAMVEIGDDLTEGGAQVPYEDESHPVYEFQADPEMDGRAALQALLSEVTEEGDVLPAAHGDTVDGLADRGPWTDSELSTMEPERGYEVSNIVPFSSVHAGEEEQPVINEASRADGSAESAADADEELDEVAPTEEPINRGLLLKFLSSVRN